jgi:hypothetical protein
MVIAGAMFGSISSSFLLLIHALGLFILLFIARWVPIACRIVRELGKQLINIVDPTHANN